MNSGCTILFSELNYSFLLSLCMCADKIDELVILTTVLIKQRQILSLFIPGVLEEQKCRNVCMIIIFKGNQQPLFFRSEVLAVFLLSMWPILCNRCNEWAKK